MTLTICVCSAETVHNPAFWSGVISSDDRGRLWRDGQLYDPEIDGLTMREIEELTYRPFDTETEVVKVARILEEE